ncbi:hypothetical protein BCR37DRAFT_378550 [Protomyces lactucae-debilis]|uniref:Uncharacterized protein n=1 Tax=Protomyces lactucae-debilis TaxID=2754530 RepID=A0A1Y2FKK2_PROLT|nr:uncharacterized protein BCR37DRAFT_378550 [Protomyces lactucae-debilis]ORY84512.1 hypothetical protein BCR37DRAFT_378550 [Protomyces lactucae-debilis]
MGHWKCRGTTLGGSAGTSPVECPGAKGRKEGGVGVCLVSTPVCVFCCSLAFKLLPPWAGRNFSNHGRDSAFNLQRQLKPRKQPCRAGQMMSYRYLCTPLRCCYLTLSSMARPCYLAILKS